MDPRLISEQELERNRANMWQDFPSPARRSACCSERSADLSKVTVPLLSSANWGGQGLHTRGNFEGCAGRVETEMAGSPRRLALGAVLHRLGVQLQKRFFGHFLKGKDNGWDKQPRVLCACAIPAKIRRAREQDSTSPPPRTQWTPFHLHLQGMRLATEPIKSAQTVTYDGTGEGITFSTPPLDREMEVTGRPR